MAYSSRQTQSPFRTFAIIWLGQVISLFGSGLTRFALGVWVYQETGSTTQFALVTFFAVLPTILLSPFAGLLVDRWNRRWVMIASDCGAGVSTLLIAFLLLTNQLDLGHIYLLATLNAIFDAFQWPAYEAVTSLLIPKQHLGRANGMIQLGLAVSQLAAPMMGGLLVVTIQLSGVLVIDFVTFLVALVTLLWVRIPQLPEMTSKQFACESWWHQLLQGWRYISHHRGLMGLLVLMAANYFLGGVAEVLGPPLILSFSSPATLGKVLSVGGSGMLVGSVVMGIWGGPKRRIYGVILFQIVGGVCILLAGIRPSAVLFASLAFAFLFSMAISSGSNRAIWQSKVPPSLQGRVFGARRAVSWATRPFAFLLAGPLVDGVFEPLMAADGRLAGTVGQLIGIGPGRGIGLLLILLGFLSVLVTIGGYLYPRLRLIEDELPDRMASETAAAPPSTLMSQPQGAQS